MPNLTFCFNHIFIDKKEFIISKIKKKISLRKNNNKYAGEM